MNARELVKLKREKEAAAIRYETKLLNEAAGQSPDGEPVDWYGLLSYRGEPVRPIWQQETRPYKNTTIRSIQELTKARNDSRYLFEINGNAQAIVGSLQSYVVHNGSTYDCVSTDEDVEPPVRKVKRVKRIIKDFRRANEWFLFELEMIQRMVCDGEFFIRLYPDEDNITKVRFVEPANIVPPQKVDWEGPWSYGILTAGNDSVNPIAYNVHDWLTGEDEEVEPQYIIHAKFHVLNNMKRGVPGFYAVWEELFGSAKERYITREGNKVRNSIAYIRQHALANQATIQALQSANITQSLTRPTPAGSQTVNYQKVEPGTALDIPKGMEYKAPPESASSSQTEISVKMALQTAGARFNMPLWCVAGTGDDSNFATALAEESPFTRSILRHQQVMAIIEDRVTTSVVEIAETQNLLDYGTLEEIDIVVTFPNPTVRDRAGETDRNLALNAAKIKSKRTIASEEGLDYDDEQQNMVDEPDTEANLDSEPASGTPAAQYSRETE